MQRKHWDWLIYMNQVGLYIDLADYYSERQSSKDDASENA